MVLDHARKSGPLGEIQKEGDTLKIKVCSFTIFCKLFFERLT